MKNHCYTKNTSVKDYDLLRDLPEEIKINYAKMLLSITKEKSVLDLGFGTGNVIVYLTKLNKGATIYGVDNSYAMYLATKKKLDSDSHLFCGDLSKFTKKFGPVDLLHFKAILHCLTEPEMLINEIIDSLKIGGLIITSHEISQTEDRIEQLFNYSGVTDKDVDYVFQEYFQLRREINLPFKGRTFPAGNSDYVSNYLVKTGKFTKEHVSNKNLSWERTVRIIDILTVIKRGTFGVFFDGVSEKNREQLYQKLILFCTKNKINIYEDKLLPCSFKVNVLRRIK